ncbi:MULTISPECIES: hypothetical protein [Escherichia]|uniref:hypothetical protein n=1 Tax=Escherichia TaxID=561 RepID=UPI0002CC9658|nr:MULTISPECIES: hypothetical protein [Escherichia]EHE9896055.1 hypothetical protein [Escherichia coli]EIK8081508.1 hypothetical protein [Escherichia coli]EJV7845892.1 hypothetical protein [Escherichia coli]EKS8397752.1 hypothetical protein [Escherichia coli]ELR8592117.1 hypothetical protein [Escherichia coli]
MVWQDEINAFVAKMFWCFHHNPEERIKIKRKKPKPERRETGKEKKEKMKK